MFFIRDKSHKKETNNTEELQGKPKANINNKNKIHAIETTEWLNNHLKSNE